MTITTYTLLNTRSYTTFLNGLLSKLPLLLDNRVTYQKEIHRDSRFAICHYTIAWQDTVPRLTYDPKKSSSASVDKKTNTPPEMLHDETVVAVLKQFLADINDTTLTRVEVKLIQTAVFPFEFNVHRDSQFKRLRHIKYLATLLLDCAGIEGGNMQLFHSEGDQLGPFTCIEELPCEPGSGYIVNEVPQLIFHGMKKAVQTGVVAHRSALLLRFF